LLSYHVLSSFSSYLATLHALRNVRLLTTKRGS